MDQIRDHPRIGLYILEDVDMNRTIKDTILYHHVYFDGKGYPAVDPDKDVPLSAYIVAMADAYDAMTSDKPYRDALPLDKVIEIVKANKGKQFHPIVVDAFMEMLKKEGKIH
jgi:HD-GYP domain-containing protein (c-di-GMP phosphodiesterase class II)